MAKDVIITPADGDIQFENSSGTEAGKIEQSGDDLVISNAVGDVLIGDGSSDVYIGDGTSNVDIIFEQNGAIKGETAAGVTLTIGSSDTTLIVQSPTLKTPTIDSKLTFTTSNGYILFDHESGSGEYNTSVPLIKVQRDSTSSEQVILERTTQNGGLILGVDDTIMLTAGDTKSTMRSNIGETGERVVAAAESGLAVYAFPNNDTSWSNRKTMLFDGVNGLNVDGQPITGSDVKIDNWGSISASLASLEASGVTTEAVRSAGAVMDDEVTDLDGIKSLTVPNNTTISTFGASLVDDADAATARTTLGLGSAATFANTSFLRTDVADSAAGIISFTNTAQSNGLTTGAIVVYGGAAISRSVNIGEDLNVGGESIFTAEAGGGKFLISGSSAASMSIDVTDDMITFDAPSNSGFTFNQGTNAFIVDMASNAPTFNGYTMWHSNNDGPGSGLNADLLDGNNASAFLKVGNNLDDLGNVSEARGNLGLNFLTTASISSPGADRILFYDDSTGDVNWLEAGSGLTISNTTISATDTNTMGDGFILEDGDTTEVQITENKEVKFVEGAGININWTNTSNGTDADPYALTFTVDLRSDLGLGSTANLILTDDGDGTMTPESNLKFNGSKLEVTGSADINGALFLRDDNYITRFTDTDTKFGFDTADNFSVFTNGNKVVNVGATSIGLFTGLSTSGSLTLNGASISDTDSVTVNDYFGFASGYNIEYVPTTAIDFNIGGTRRFRINSSGVEVTGSLSLQDLTVPGTVTLTGLTSGNEGNSLMINTSGVVSTRELGPNAFSSASIPTAYFSAVQVGAVVAGAEAADTLEFIAGDNITLNLNNNLTEELTISATTASYSAGTGIDLAGSTFNLDLTEITLGPGLDSTATGLSLDLSELSNMTSDVVGTQDKLILLDNELQRKKLISEISLSEFDNDLGTVDTSGTPANTQLAVFTDSNTISGSNSVTWDGSDLNVNGSGSFDYFRVIAPSPGNSTAYISAGTGNSQLILKSTTGQSRIELNPGFNTAAKIETGNANDLQLGTDNTTLIHLDHANSNVGVGTTTLGSDRKFGVVGDSLFTGNTNLDGPVSMSNGTSTFTLHLNGAAGTANIHMLSAFGSRIRTTNATDLILGVNNTDILTIDSTIEGVGINQPNPTEELDVDGNIAVSGYLTGSFYNGISTLGAGTTHSIDLESAQIFTKTLTADTQFYFSNYKTGVVKDLIISGNHDLVFNTSQHDEINIIGAASYDGTQDNLIQVLCTDDSSNGKFWLTISRT